MEENNYGWIWWIVIIVAVYLLFFKGGDSTNIEPLTSTIDQKQLEIQDRLDEQEQKINDQQNQIDEQKQKQQDYNDCINLWSNANDYIKPEDVAYCRRMYLE